MASDKRAAKRTRKGSSILVRVPFEDDSGRKWIVLVPMGREGEVEKGIPVGPPDTASLGLPEEVNVRLNNQLFNRGLLTLNDIRQRPSELQAALQAAYRVDAARLMNLYKEERNAT